MIPSPVIYVQASTVVGRLLRVVIKPLFVKVLTYACLLCCVVNLWLSIWLIVGCRCSSGYLNLPPTTSTPPQLPPTHLPYMCNLWSFQSWKKAYSKLSKSNWLLVMYLFTETYWIVAYPVQHSGTIITEKVVRMDWIMQKLFLKMLRYAQKLAFLKSGHL